MFLCKTGDLAPGQVRRIDRKAGDIAVYNVDGTFYATDDRCTHGLSSLAEGDLIGDEIECSMHFGSFNVKTGEAMAPPCSIPIRTYKVEVRGDEVFARIVQD
ncbi:MAG: non-heme iron oxygenase ferredoxin subunit [Alphaproteobacteria bacterium]|nr:non-heme iron oxygenase ferredoxin subunit [Alphaproteobacteria bacterium]